MDGEIAAVASNAPREAKDARYRVLRGGSWFAAAGYCRSAYRFGSRPVYRDRVIGFRLCVFPGSGEATSPEPEAKPEAESATLAKARRDDAAVAEVADAAVTVDLSQESFTAAQRPQIF